MIIMSETRTGFPSAKDLAEISMHGRLVDDLRFALSNPLDEISQDDTLPLLEDWSISVRYASCLMGTAYGHPNFPGREHPCITSELILFAPELRLARTKSRWFRLGTRVETGEA